MKYLLAYWSDHSERRNVISTRSRFVKEFKGAYFPTIPTQEWVQQEDARSILIIARSTITAALNIELKSYFWFTILLIDVCDCFQIM